MNPRDQQCFVRIDMLAMILPDVAQMLARLCSNAIPFHEASPLIARRRLCSNAIPFHEASPLIARRAVEGDLDRFMVAMHGTKVVVLP